MVDLENGRVRNLTRGLPVTVSWIEWTGEGRSLLAALYERGQQAVARFDLNNSACKVLWRGKASFDRFWPRFSISRTGRIAAACEDKATPREVWSGTVGAASISWRPITDVNYRARAWSHPRFEEVEWSAEDGQQVSGLLMLPANVSGRSPMVVWVHGGPNFLHQHLFYAIANPWIIAALPELLAAQGLAVFLPNPRGSIGWGSEFAEAVIGDMGGRDGSDILSGVTACVDGFDVDAERLGIGGWSYGGFMTAWLISRTDRFKAAVVGAGVSNWRSLHGTSAIGAWDRQYLRDDPYRVGGEYDNRSPLTHVRQVGTPTLLVNGSADVIVPPGQAIEFASALRESGGIADVRIYRGEGHDFSSRRAQVELANDIVSWFQRWLLPE